MSRPDAEGLFRKLLILAFLAFALTISLVRPGNRTQAQLGCPIESYDYCDANYGMWVNPYTCACAPYCSIAEPDCTNIGGTLDYDACKCVMPPTVFDPCNDYNNSINCGGDLFSRTFSGITWVYGTGNCNPDWANRCATLGGSFNYNDCTCDLGPAYIPPSASPTPPSTERCPQGSPAQLACDGSVAPGVLPRPRFDTVTCTCKWWP